MTSQEINLKRKTPMKQAWKTKKDPCNSIGKLGYHGKHFLVGLPGYVWEMFWNMFGRFSGDCWKSLGKISDDDWGMFERLLEDCWQICGRCLEDVWEIVG